ncbi:MAG: rRNA maturation RNase YbeY [Mucinivorans sp.]
MAINFIDIDHHAVIGARRAVKKWIEQAIIEEGYTLGEITIAFCSDSYITAENVRFLGHDYATDIITFDNSTDKIASADLLISVETVHSNAQRFEVSPEREMLRVIVHGVLHIIGYDDTNEEKQAKMSEREDYYLSKFDSLKK